MPKVSYSDRQIEAANMLRSAEREEVSSEVIDEILALIGEAEKNPTLRGVEERETEMTIKMKIMNEPDWRKRASLAAMLISKSFS